MEEPQIIDEPTNTATKRKEPKKTKKASKNASRINGVAISYLIVVIIFVLGVIICSVDNGALDYQITMFFYKQLGGTEAFPGPMYEFGQFFNPSPVIFVFSAEDVAETWGKMRIGGMFSEIFLVMGVIYLIVSLVAYGKEKKQAKVENRPIVMPDSTKYYKYCWVLIIAGAIVALGLTQLVKGITGRWRPYDLDITHLFTPWFVIAGNDSDSFWSGHTAQATLTTALPLFFLGSRKKVLAYVFAILTAVYTTCVGMGRMISGHHYFSDVLFGGFIVYTAIIFSYYVLLDIPGQERIYRYQRTYKPFNEGYKLILEGKAAIRENKAEGVKSVTAGLEKLAIAKANAEDINKYHHEFGPFIARIDDLASRIGILMQKQPIDPKDWSYLC
ncbi:MAG: phosphatase PAP2 family protein [Candidatus Sigynarchaeota archaeon]